MPNWCSNTVTAFGTKDQIQEMATLITDANSFLDGLLPQQEEWDHSKWVEIYGTKWTDSDPQITQTTVNDTTDMLTAKFLTAWAPPIDGLIKITENWDNATFGISFSEIGMGIFGYSIAKNTIMHVDIDFDCPDFGEWDTDPDACISAQVQYEENLYMSMMLTASLIHGVTESLTFLDTTA